MAFSLVLSLVVAELCLRYQAKRVQTSDRLDPGLVEYDPSLGWRLAANWRGRHRHYDFDTSYSTNDQGFRAMSHGSDALDESATRYAVVGDSFSFGLGVGDDETFVHRLDVQAGAKARFLNYSVPGFSTDQQCLLIEQRVIYARPDVIMLVVYLGNDLMDNTLGYPLQADRAKPYFVTGPDGLVLMHDPVPLTIKPADQRQIKPADLVVGPIAPRSGFFPRWLRSLELTQLFGLESPLPDDLPDRMSRRVPQMLDLYTRIVERVGLLCERQDIELIIALLPGRSYVLRPESLSAKVQEYLRSEVMRSHAGSSLRVIDLASALRSSTEPGHNAWYFPYEGHLTPEGHRVVANLISNELNLDD